MCGSIPFSIGRLSLLEVLDLGLNHLNGSLSEWIGGLSSLQKLYLSHNRLDGNLPDRLGQLTRLVNLDISFDLFTGVVTEAHFTNLVSLNSLEGKENNLTLRLQVANWIPPFRLQRFSLSSWFLGPQFPLWLQSQKDLTCLDISNTRISSLMPDSFVRSFHNLYYLNMSRNHIQGTLTLLGVPSVEGRQDTYDTILGLVMLLDLSSNNFSGHIPNEITTLKKLKFFNRSRNQLTGRIPERIGDMKALESFDLLVNKLSGNFP
ncbi:putative non-specific serine/threonine protein kinase [Helianthus anomalus]